MCFRCLSGEKKKDDETVDSLGPLEKGQVCNEALRELRVQLSKKNTADELDGFRCIFKNFSSGNRRMELCYKNWIY
uniref:cell division cycle protein 23 homolog n=1 Tax=Monopterus albus TaxID=43700 RepID=UPI0009B3FA7A|nr:cell division cycle protein 23 homolog [Monopterus albus]XP_020469210.1 cell division cycle protein 23 homolog [Monopterus albus]